MLVWGTGMSMAGAKLGAKWQELDANGGTKKASVREEPDAKAGHHARAKAGHPSRSRS